MTVPNIGSASPGSPAITTKQGPALKLVKTAVDKLDRPIAIQFLQTLEPARMSKALTRCVGNALSELDSSDVVDRDEPETVIPPSARNRKHVPDVRQQTLPLPEAEVE